MMVVISDLHFGIDSATLLNENIVREFVQELKNSEEDVEKIIILGDAFDFWRSRPYSAFKSSIPFFEGISELNANMVYVIGNHDHHLVIMDHEARFIDNLKKTGIPEYMKFSNELNLDNFLDRICSFRSIEIKYPYHKENIGNKSFLFQHGHHLDFFQTLIPKLMSYDLFKEITGENTYPENREKFEIVMSQVYENLYQSAFVGELVDIENGFWSIPDAIGAIRGKICKTLRYTPVKAQYNSIVKFTQKYNDQDQLSCFVYGDTHKAGMHQEKEGLLAVNSGCWLDEPNKEAWGNPQELPNTYITIDENITIRKLGQSEPLFDPFPMEKLL